MKTVSFFTKHAIRDRKMRSPREIPKPYKTMQKISASVVINVQIKSVFAALTNVTSNVDWIRSVVRVELIDELPIEEGFRFRETGGFMGVNTTDEKQVIVFQPPHLFGFAGQFLGNSTLYQLTTLDDGMTEVKVTLAGTPPRGTPKIVQRNVLRQAVKRISADLERLGQKLEAQAMENRS